MGSGVRSSLRVLRHRDYRLMTFGGVVSQLGTWAQYVGAGWAASQLSDSNLVVTGTFAAQFAPVLFLAPFAGVVADRYDRRKLVIAANAFMALPPFVIGLLFQSDRLESWSLIALVGVGGIGLAFANPASLSIAPDLVPRDEIGPAVGVNSALLNLTRVVGPGLGGATVGLWGVAWSFHLNALSFLAVVVAASMIRWRHTARPAPIESFAERFRRGLSYSRSNRAVGLTLWITLVIGFCTMHASLMPVIARQLLDGDVSTYAQLAAAPGFGAVLGSLLAGRSLAGGARRRMVATSIGLTGVAVGTVSMSRSVPLTFAALVLFGLSFFLNSALSTTLLMQVAADEYRGRVMGLFGMVQVGTIPVGALAGGVLSSAIGVPTTVGFNAAVLFAALAWLTATQRLRALDGPEPPGGAGQA